ncbi:MAG: S8 family serine peptidase [Actinomycetales bacterium]|nr:S8 family serine peptidase [Actinomycetales bacterium]
MGAVSGVVLVPGANAVELSWTNPVSGPVPEGVFVEVCDPDGVVSAFGFAGPVTRAKVNGLRNGVEYLLRVIAVTSDGAGEPSEWVSVTPSTGMEGVVAGVIVEFTDSVNASEGSREVPGKDRVGEVDLTVGEKVTEDAVLVELSETVDLETAERIAGELAADAQVAWAEPDQFLFTAAEPTQRTRTQNLGGSDAWHLAGEFGVNAGAVSDSAGAGSVVAVIDTGITEHASLDARVVAGYDFVSSPDMLSAVREPGADPVAFDGDYLDPSSFGVVGRDANPRDPGDWRAVAPVRDSTWHGTATAGVIADVAPGVSIQPVRALSWRGGLLSDVAASITWASGGSVDGVGVNANPASVINMSFAAEATCPLALQEAIDGARSRGVVLVAAAGNAGADARSYAPGNCNGVITVGATTHDGQRAAYSNHGPAVDVSAPGGSHDAPVITTSNTGEHAAESPTRAGEYGTSIAASHVAAAAAILSADEPNKSVDEVYEALTGRDHTQAFANDTCDSANPDYTCGTGILVLAQVASDGALDTAFTTNLGTGFNFRVRSVAVQPDKKIVAAGSFTTVNGTSINRIARLNADGSLDTDFATNVGTGLNGAGRSVTVQSDGKIIVAGAFTSVNGTAINHIARFNPDGSLDTDFVTNVGTGFSTETRGIAVQSDGKIIVVGDFKFVNGAISKRIARLNSDGTPDTDFTTNIGDGFGTQSTRIVIVQPDDKIIAGGQTTTVDGTASNGIARFDSDGTPDLDFTTNIGNGLVAQGTRAIALQSDGKILVGGIFTRIDGNTSNYIARLNTDGTPDLDFTTNIGTGFNGFVNSMAVQPDDKIIVGGQYTSVDGTTSNRIARLNADGTLDTDYTASTGTGFQAKVWSVALQCDGKAIVVGDYTTVNSVSSNRMARLDGSTSSCPPDPTPQAAPTPAAAPRLGWVMDPERDGYVLVGSKVATIAAEIRTASGRVRPLAEDDSLQVVPGDSVDLDLAGLAPGSALGVSFVFDDPDRPECAVKDQAIGTPYDSSLIERGVQHDVWRECPGVWEVTLTGTTGEGVAFKFTTPVTVLRVTDVTQGGGAKKAYYFQPKSAAFIPTGKRKLNRLARRVPADAVEVIAEVTGVSVSMKNKKSNAKLAKKRCFAIEEYLADQLGAYKVTFVAKTASARKRGGAIPVGEAVVRDKRGKPLTTVTLSYATTHSSFPDP